MKSGSGGLGGSPSIAGERATLILQLHHIEGMHYQFDDNCCFLQIGIQYFDLIILCFNF